MFEIYHGETSTPFALPSLPVASPRCSPKIQTVEIAYPHQTILTTMTAKPEIANRVYIGNVDYKAQEDELRQLFADLNV